MVDIGQILRNQKLRVDHPEQQEGLVSDVTDAEAPTDYENSYKIVHKVPCAFCAKKTLHQWGVTAVLADGRRALCGNCCAKRVFGAEVHAKLKADLEKREDTVVRMHLLGPIVDAAEPVIASIKDEWAGRESVIDNAVHDLAKYVPRSGLKADGDTLAVRDYWGKYFGKVRGMNAFRDCGRSLFKGGTMLFEIRKMFGGDLSNIDVQKASRLRQDAIYNIKKGILFFESAKRLFGTDENLNLLGAFMELHDSECRRCEVVYDSEDARREMVYERRPPSSDIFWINVPPTSAFEDMPTEEELIKPLLSV